MTGADVAPPPGRPPLMPLDEALERLLAQAAPTLGAETVPTFDADGRVLASDLVSALQVPPQDNSSMDQVEEYQSSNDAYVIETYEKVAFVENIEIQE